MNITETTTTPATLVSLTDLSGIPAGVHVQGLVVKSTWRGESLTDRAPSFVETSYTIDGMNYQGSDFAVV